MAAVNMWNIEATRVVEKLEKKISEGKQLAEDTTKEKNLVKQKATLSQVKQLKTHLVEIITAYAKLSNKQMEEVTVTYDKLIETKLDAEEIICQLEILGETKPTPEINHSHSEIGVKLPKFEINKFYGDVTKFTEFWEAFEASIHNSKLTSVQKFTYLRGYLSGPAEKAIRGLRLTDENYNLAIEKLKDKFGRNQDVINAHYTSIRQIPKADNSAYSLRSTLDEIEINLRSLEVLGEDTNHNSIFTTIYSKFPETFLSKVEESGDTSTVKNLRESMEKILTAKEKARNSSQSFDKNERNDKCKKKDAHFNDDENTSEKNNDSTPKCRFCQNSHYSDLCKVVKTVEQRKEKVKDLCNICFKSNHKTEECNSSRGCFYCKKRKSHHQSLCPEKFGPATNTVSKQNQNNKESKPKQSTSTTVLFTKGQTSTLSYAETILVNGDNEQITLAVFDTGSEKSYITEEAVKSLKIKPDYFQTLNIGQFSGTSVEKTTKVVTFQLKLPDSSLIDIRAYTIPKIASNCKNRFLPKDFHKSQAVENLKYANTGSIEDIGLLIGNDYAFELMTLEKIELQKHLFLIGSKLGWLLAGRTDNEKCLSTSCLLAPLEDHMQKIWSLHVIGIKEEYQHTNDDEALEHFYKNVEYANNKYTVSWPWKNYPPELPTNYGLALGQLQSTVKRLDDQILMKYDDIFEEQEKLKIIEEIDNNDEVEICHYLPHHPVFTPEKSTAMRIVFNGSAKTNVKNLSLNDCLIKGRVQLEHIAALLIRFRIHSIALVADIEKAYLQINLHKKDRDVVRFIWITNLKKLLKMKKKMTPKEFAEIVIKNIKIMRFTSVPFGVITSPFILAITLRYHLKKFPHLVRLIEDIYADNLATGEQNAEEAIKLYKLVKECFQKASMNMRKWKSNSEEVNNSIQDEDKEKNETISLLGLIWSTKEDTLNVKLLKNSKNEEVTKRVALKTNGSIFDPLGFLLPVVITARIFVKKLWKQNLEWDEPLSSQLKEEWYEIQRNLEDIHEVKIQRHLGYLTAECQIHCFVDASKDAYATVVYLRMKRESNITIKLIFAKARVSPVKEMSIPRLELMAATIGGRAIKFVQTSLNTKFESFIWSDSKCVLYWLNSIKILPIFVTRRVNEIKTIEAKHRYVPTKENPADLASRGCSLTELNESNWWSAPQWLKSEEKEWPKNLVVSENEAKNDLEKFLCKETKALLINENIVEEIPPPQPPFNMKIEDYSDLESLLIATSEQIEENEHDEESPVKKAERMWLLFDQKTHYSKQNLKSNFPKKLKIEKDEDDLIRIDGRIKNADINIETKYPILLVKRSHLTKLIILNEHEKVAHSGTSHTLAKLREKFWLPHGRKEVYSIISKFCENRKRDFAKPFKAPEIAPLPEFRIKKDSRPFESTGVDVFGPIFIRKSINPDVEKEKRWIIIFTCLTTRAIHLEVMNTMHSAEFLHAFRRFVAVRNGAPDLIVSDNAPQFIVLKNTIQDLWSEITKDGKVSEYFKSKAIQWKLIPHYAPWMGGAYERLIKITKDAIRRTHGKITFSDRQLVTVAYEIAAIVNSRPLTYVGREPDSIIITPNHFLQIKFPGINLNQEKNDDTPTREKIGKLWKVANEYLNQVWKYWETHYLLSLRERYETMKSAYRTTNREPKVGEKVIILEESPDRGNWKVAKIESLTKSSGGIVRSVMLRQSNGNITSRPIVKIAPLEMNIEDASIPEQLDTTAQPEIEEEEFDEIIDIECEERESDVDDS